MKSAQFASHAQARVKLSEMHALEAARYVDPVTLASVHASLGEFDVVVRFYQKAMEDRSPDMVYARTLTRLAPRLLENADYQAIPSRLNFPAPTN